MHDPEERAVLDALELLIREQSWPTARDRVRVVKVEDLQHLIQHRRAILSAPESDPAELPFPLAETAEMG
jgi:hypothetical protein